MNLEVQLVHQNARLPRRGSDGAAGLDLYACESVTVPSIVNTKLVMLTIMLQALAPLNSLMCLLHLIVAYKAFNSIKTPSAIIDTGVRLARLSPKNYGRIAPRSGLAAKNGICVGAGVIDSDYRGNIKVLLFNHSPVPFKVKTGDRVAQLVIEAIEPCTECATASVAEETVRGSNGFGSTGI